MPSARRLLLAVATLLAHEWQVLGADEADAPMARSTVDADGKVVTPLQEVVDVNASAAAIPDMGFIDFEGKKLSDSPSLDALNQRCLLSARRAVADQASHDTPEPSLSVYPDPLEGVSVDARPHGSTDVRLVYFIMASRVSAPQTIARLLRALRHPTHLFLIHIDLKMSDAVVNQLRRLAAGYPNVRVLKTRRLVQWGGFSMVSALLDALASFVPRLDFDFLINLSDADLALRTNDEMVAFLRHFRGRIFMRVDPQAGAATGGGATDSPGTVARRHAYLGAALRTNAVIECGGFGFVSVNTSHDDDAARAAAALGRPCCVGQSGPLVHANLSFVPPQPPANAHGEYRGSQWAILPSDFCRHLLEDRSAIEWARFFERRLLPDEFYLPTVLMHSPFRHRHVNHHLRYEAWAAGGAKQRAAYWETLPQDEWGGAMALNVQRLRGALRSPMLFAKKVAPSVDATVYPMYDAWVKRKLAGEADPDQPPIAAPMLRIDPELFGLSAPPLQAPHRRGGEARPDERLPPPRRVLRRRRISSLVFADGSMCSCAPDCEPSTAESFLDEEEKAAALAAAAVARAAETGEEMLPSGSVPERICCADTKDGRAALCVAGAKAGADRLDHGGDEGDDEEARDDDAEEERVMDEWPTLSSLPSAPMVACPVARAEVASTGEGGAPLVALFVNRAPFPVRVYQVDSRKVEVPVLSLRAGEHAEVEGLSTYAWRARSLGGGLMLELESTPQPASNDAGGAATIHIAECSSSSAAATAAL